MSKENKGSICYIVSHGFASRMICQTNLLGRLREQGFRVSVICPDSSDPVLSEYCIKWGIELFEFVHNSNILKSNYMLYRMYFLENIYSNPALYEKHYYEIHHAKRKYRILNFIPYLLICIHFIVNKLPVLRKAFRQIEKRILNSKRANIVLQKIHPDILVSTYPVSPEEGVLLHNAAKTGIRTCIQLLSWDNITSKGYFLSTADYYLVWGPIMRDELIEKYKVSPENIYITGVAHFDIHKETALQAHNSKRLTQFGLDANKPYLVFGMSAPRFVPREIDIVEFLSRKLNENYFGNNLQMIIRPHPQNVKGWMADHSWIERLQALENNRIKLFYPLLAESNLPWSMQHEDLQALSEVLAKCIVCINSCSTLSIDTLMAGRGNIAPMFDGDISLPYWSSTKRLCDYMHIKKFIEIGGTQKVEGYNELLNSIEMHSANIHYNFQERQNAIQLECGNTDQPATEKIIRTLENILAI